MKGKCSTAMLVKNNDKINVGERKPKIDVVVHCLMISLAREPALCNTQFKAGLGYLVRC